MLIPPIHNESRAISLPSSGRGDTILLCGRGRLKNSRQASALIALFSVLSDFGIIIFSHGLYFIRKIPRSSSFNSMIAFLKICLIQVGYISFALLVLYNVSIHCVKTEVVRMLNMILVVPIYRSK